MPVAGVQSQARRWGEVGCRNIIRPGDAIHIERAPAVRHGPQRRLIGCPRIRICQPAHAAGPGRINDATGPQRRKPGVAAVAAAARRYRPAPPRALRIGRASWLGHSLDSAVRMNCLGERKKRERITVTASGADIPETIALRGGFRCSERRGGQARQMCTQAVHQDQRARSRLHGADVAGGQPPIYFTPTQSGYVASIRDRSASVSVNAAPPLRARFSTSVMPIEISSSTPGYRLALRDIHTRGRPFGLLTVQQKGVTLLASQHIGS